MKAVVSVLMRVDQTDSSSAARMAVMWFVAMVNMMVSLLVLIKVDPMDDLMAV